jgi:hypothetical protein
MKDEAEEGNVGAPSETCFEDDRSAGDRDPFGDQTEAEDEAVAKRRGNKFRHFRSEERQELDRAAAALTNADEKVASPLSPPPMPMGSHLREGASSEEEDSVAEMDYMSEGSNLSVKDLPVEDLGGGGSSEALTEDNYLATMSAFMPRLQASNGSRALDVPFQTPLNVHSSSTKEGSSPPSSSNSYRGVPTASILKQWHRQTERMQEKFAESQKPAATAGESSSSGAGGCKYASSPMSLPHFRDPHISMWTASHAANCPTEDRSASLVNLLLQPLPPNFDSETQLPPLEPDYKTLIRLNLWGVVDGHGGGCVATYASEVLLPHIAASVSRMLGCAIVSRGTCTVNGQLRDANALDLDGLIKTSDRSHGNPNSIHYRSPFERSDSEDENDLEAEGTNLSELDEASTAVPATTAQERKQIASLVKAQAAVASSTSSLAPTIMPRRKSKAAESEMLGVDASVSSVKTSVKTAASPANRDALVGTHSPQEVAAITRAIAESFLAVDEGWINSIDPVATHQTSCQNNGRWNSGACALVVFTIQRLVRKCPLSSVTIRFC